MQYHCHVYCKMGGGEGRGAQSICFARGISPLHQELLIKDIGCEAEHPII